MHFKLLVTSILVVCATSRHIKGSHKSSHNVVNRQQIANAGQMVQVNDLIRELNRQQANSNNGPVELSPNNAEAVNGPTGAGMGLPFGTLNSRIDKNPLIGANGLSKSALNDIMFGNFKGLAVPEGNNIASYASEQPESVQGGEMRQMLGGQDNSLQLLNGNRMNGNGMGNNMMSNLANLAAANNLAGTQGLNGFNVNPNNGLSMTTGTMSSLGLNGVSPNLIGPTGMNSFPGAPLQVPNPALGMQFMSQLSNMNAGNDGDEEDFHRMHHHRRHHRHHKHRKSTTKLLLRLLVDKMKDIYELDKMTTKPKNKKTKSESAGGKIGLTLDDLGVPKDDVHRGDKTKITDKFKTKFSFPVTVSDETEHQHLKLKSDDDNAGNSSDDADIQKILSKLNIGNDGSGSGAEPSKKSEDLKISELTDSVSKDIAAATRFAESASKRTMLEIKGQIFKDEKANSRDSIRNLKYGTDFHGGKTDNDMHTKPGVKKSKTSNILGIEDFEGYDNAKVIAPKMFSMSSILNGAKNHDDIEDTPTMHSKLADSLLDYIPNKRKAFPEVDNTPMVPSDINPEEDRLKGLTETIYHDVTSKVEDGANYVKSARVLGSVFKKVKDPVAKKSIQTAIKAMLEVMKYKAIDKKESSSKKFSFPADANAVLWQQIYNLNGVLQKMKKHLHHKRKE